MASELSCITIQKKKKKKKGEILKATKYPQTLTSAKMGAFVRTELKLIPVKWGIYTLCCS